MTVGQLREGLARMDSDVMVLVWDGESYVVTDTDNFIFGDGEGDLVIALS